MTLDLHHHKHLYSITLISAFSLITVALIFVLGKTKHYTEFPNTGRAAAEIPSVTGNQNKLLYGSNIDISQLLPTSPYYIKNSKGEDMIDIAHRLGINVFRISSVLQAFPDQTPDVIYTKDQWDTVLNKMNNYGMKAIINTDTHSNKIYTSDEISDDFLLLVKKYIIDSQVGDNPAVYAFDLKNEPTLSPHNLDILQQEYTMLKQRYPNVLLTVGGWKVANGSYDASGNKLYRWNEPPDGQLVSNIVDFYSPHIYGFDRSVHHTLSSMTATITNYLDQMELYTNNKQILFSEFGSANGDSVSDQQTLGSRELQANTYYAMYTVLSSYSHTNILGSVGYVLYSRNQFPDSFAILKNKGDSIYPAAYVLQKFSLGTADVSIPMPYASVPDNVTLSTADNTATKSAHVNSMVLLSLPGTSTNTYQMSILPSNTVNVIQNLQYNIQLHKFFAILKTSRTGTFSISVEQVPTTISPSGIYTTTLIVN